MEDFKEHLFTPERFRKPEDLFQDAVVTLLSLAGYSVIILGKKQYTKDTGKKTKKYETLHLDTGYLIGSADILAYRENELLLIDCTINSPDEKKIQKFPELIDYLESLSTDVPLNITAIIFTPRDSVYNDEEKVRIVDAWKLDQILDAILMNDVETARSKLIELRVKSPVSF